MENNPLQLRTIGLSVVVLLSLITLTHVTAPALSQGDTPQYDSIYDINGDGKINVVDIELVASKWGAEATPVATLSPTSTPGGCTGEQNVSGLITSDTRWVKTCTYVVEGNVSVERGVTLVIEPGASVAFKGPYQLQVGGTLIAQGTVDERIAFSGYSTDQTWRQIVFTGDEQANGILQHVTIEDTDVRAVFVDMTASPYIADNIIELAGGQGISVNAPSGPVTIERNLVESTIPGRLGVFILSGMETTDINVRYNTLGGSDNSGITYGIQIAGELNAPIEINRNNLLATDVKLTVGEYHDNPSLTLNAENNWWGTIDPAEIETNIHHHNDDINVPWVDYEPFASGPIPGAP